MSKLIQSKLSFKRIIIEDDDISDKLSNVVINDEKKEPVEEIPVIVNKGTGAGGANTNKSGKGFEKLTACETFLVSNGFTKKGDNKKCYYEYQAGNKKIQHLTQGYFKEYIQKTYGVKLFRNPDDAFIIVEGNQITIKILEKKNQNGDGSVDTKLWAGPSLKREYQICFNRLQDNLLQFKVEYAFTLNKFFKTKFTDPENKDHAKYSVLKEILDENSIKVFYGHDDDYLVKLFDWVN